MAASGSTPLSYQWFKDGVALVGANGASVSIPTGAADAGKTLAITVRVSNGAGQVTSAVANLVVKPAATGLVSAVINASEGGSLSTANGAATLEVPAGALSGNATVSIATQAPSAFTLPEGFMPLGDAFTIGVSGGTLKQPLWLSFPNPETALPDGTVLVLAQLAPSSAKAAKASASSARARAQMILPDASLFGIPSQAFKADSINLDFIDTSKIYLLGAAALDAVGGKFFQIAGDPRLSQLPGTKETACAKDEDFISPAGISLEEGQLHSRHVACGRFQETDLVDVLVNDANGVSTRVDFGARVALDVKWSVHGPAAGGANKKLMFQISQTMTTASAAVTAKDLPTVRYRALALCDTAGGSPTVTCPGSAQFDLAPNGKTTVDVTVDAQWNKTERDWSAFSPALKLVFSSDGMAPDADGSGRTRVLQRGLQVNLRCDAGLALAGSNGCVFADAAAVYLLDRIDSKVKEAAEHIFEAQNNPDPAKRSPGKWKMKSGTRAVADSSVAGVHALQRAKSEVVRDANRKSACEAENSASLINIRIPLNQSTLCAAGTQTCSCDEYPFASTWSGGRFDPDRTSVKRINAAQNNSAGGGKLTGFFTKQRVVDHTIYPDLVTPYDPDAVSNRGGDDFWVYIK